ncbi:hypothetical protein Bhyg_17589, partial [Pseudolycoriella hygida]
MKILTTFVGLLLTFTQ